MDRINTSSLVRKFNQLSRKSRVYLLNMFDLSVRPTFAEFPGPEAEQTTAADMAIPLSTAALCRSLMTIRTVRRQQSLTLPRQQGRGIIDLPTYPNG